MANGAVTAALTGRLIVFFTVYSLRGQRGERGEFQMNGAGSLGVYPVLSGGSRDGRSD